MIDKQTKVGSGVSSLQVIYSMYELLYHYCPANHLVKITRTKRSSGTDKKQNEMNGKQITNHNLLYNVIKLVVQFLQSDAN